MSTSRVLATSLVALVFATVGHPATIRLGEDKGRQTIEVTGLSAETIAALGKLANDDAKWSKILAVRVDKDGALTMLGTYHVGKDALRFQPRFPLTKGVRYKAVYDPAALGAPGKPVELAMLIPKPESKSTTTVRRVYPTTDKLPENQLKFYLHFTAPMSQGEAYRNIQLLDDKGKAIDMPFLELDQELWDPSGKRFTLFIDPGRIKRGLKPREDAGPVLEEGKRYTLVIDRAWSDAEGNTLKEGFKKSFAVGAPDDAQPDVKTWKLKLPVAGGLEPLRVTFPKSMDHALCERIIWVNDATGKRIDGKIDVTERETLWTFTPSVVWREGSYQLVADKRLEDLAGNSIGQPFEIDVLKPVQAEIKTETVAVPFVVKK